MNVTGSTARSAKPAASTCPVWPRPSTGYSVVSRPGRLELVPDHRRRRRRPGVARVVDHVQLEGRAEGRVVVRVARRAVQARRRDERGRLGRAPASPGSSRCRPAPITVVEVDDVGGGTVVVGEPVEAGL